MLSLAVAAVLGHRVCHSVVLNVQDDWCDTNCNGKAQNCVADYCMCDPSPNCKSLSPSVKNSWCNDNCPLGNCPPTLCSCPAISTSTEASAGGQGGQDGQAPAPLEQAPAPLEQAPAPTAVPVAAPQQAQAMQLPMNSTVQATSGCAAMTSITPEQLLCAFTMLDAGRAQEYAAAATSKVGALLGTTCAWAAFLGNVAVESKELTIWKEIQVRHAQRQHPLPRPPATPAWRPGRPTHSLARRPTCLEPAHPPNHPPADSPARMLTSHHSLSRGSARRNLPTADVGHCS